jgi:hypothetical protein
MKVKVGENVFDSTNQPIMVMFDEEDMKILETKVSALAEYPSDFTPETKADKYDGWFEKQSV